MSTTNSNITSEKEVQFFELEKARFIIKDATGLDLAYAYEDLVFSEHGLFILQFDTKKADSMFCWFNKECIDTERHKLFKSITTTANLNYLKIIYKGKFEMVQKDEDQITLKFIKAYNYQSPDSN